MLVRGAARLHRFHSVSRFRGPRRRCVASETPRRPPRKRKAQQLSAAVVSASGASVSAPTPFLILPVLPADYFATTPHLLGEWPGLRSKLDDLGIKVSLTGVDEAVLNLSGGERRIAQEAGQVAFRPNSTCKRVWACMAPRSW